MITVHTPMVDYNNLWAKDWTVLQEIGPLNRSLERLILSTLSPHVPKEGKVLDVGCGNGRLLSLLLKRFPNISVRGIEGSEEAIRHAPLQFRRFLIQKDLERGFDFPNETFDLIICTEVLEHLNDYIATLQSIIRHMKPNAFVLITVPHSIRYWSKSDESAGHRRRFEFENFQKELRDRGLDPVRFFTWGFPVSFIYKLVSQRIDPNKLMRRSNMILKRAISKIIYHMVKLDDFFIGKQWHQLIVLAKKCP